MIQSEQESRFSCAFLTISTLTYRSIAVDYIHDRKAKVVYIYFDYKSHESQTWIDIARSLLKQLLSQLAVIPDDLAEYVMECKSKSQPVDSNTVIEYLLSLSSLSPVYAIFDAMDECSENNLRKVLKLFNKLQGLFRLLISTRHHLVQSLRDHIDDVQVINIKGDTDDVENYVRERLRTAKNTKPALEENCVALVKDVEGLYSPQP
jgi:hypothetical protein